MDGPEGVTDGALAIHKELTDQVEEGSPPVRRCSSRSMAPGVTFVSLHPNRWQPCPRYIQTAGSHALQMAHVRR